MYWKNALKDRLPKHKEEVIISVKGVNYISIFCADKKLFKVEKEMTETLFKVEEHLIYWTELPKDQ
jgi:hypothetical protein